MVYEAASSIGPYASKAGDVLLAQTTMVGGDQRCARFLILRKF